MALSEKDDFALTLALMLGDKSKRPEWMTLALDFEFIDDCAKKKMDQETTFKHLMEGSSPNARSNKEGEEGWTPLMYEADRGSGQSLRVLFLHNPDPNLKSDAGETALMLACRKGNFTVFKELIIEFALAKTLEMNATNKDGKTALMIAAEAGNAEHVDGLLNHGSNPMLADKDGKTALMYAIQGQQMGCLQSLLKRDANPMQKDNAGKNAYDYAREASQEHIFPALDAKRKEYAAKMGDAIDNDGLLTGQHVSVGKPLSFKK